MSIIKVDYGSLGGGTNSIFENLGTVTNGQVISCGFKPKHIVASFLNASYGAISVVYDADVDPNKYYQYFSTSVGQKTIGDGSIGLNAVGDDGFTLSTNISATNFRYLASAD